MAAAVAKEVCIKNGGVTYCKASPIRNCSCERPREFVDPFYREPEPKEFENLDALLREFRRILDVWEGSQREERDGEKLLILWKISQLMLLKDVNVNLPIVITVF